MMLQGKWYRDLDRAANGITDWNSLALAFYKKYFSASKTNAIRAQITSFKQGPDEKFHEAWVRFKKLVRTIPHHGFEKWSLCNQFYNGLYDGQRAILDAAASDRLQENVGETKGWNIIDDLATHKVEYGNSRGNQRRSAESPSVAALEALTARFDKYELGGASKGGIYHVNAVSDGPFSCKRCGGEGHAADGCSVPFESCAAFQYYRQTNTYYEPNVHPNLRWSSQNVLNPTQPPQQQQQQCYVPPHKQQ
ncbi:uncharacterized protein LOC141638202 [Silene latifolia]|uniref:uncharacterized protein LOC141638202 n=1 Tax=Silene latifolia TaxID=37657 RepID=UPI003D77089B